MYQYLGVTLYVASGRIRAYKRKKSENCHISRNKAFILRTVDEAVVLGSFTLSADKFTVTVYVRLIFVSYHIIL